MLTRFHVTVTAHVPTCWDALAVVYWSIYKFIVLAIQTRGLLSLLLSFALWHILLISQSIFISMFCGNTYRRFLLFKHSPTSESLLHIFSPFITFKIQNVINHIPFFKNETIRITSTKHYLLQILIYFHQVLETNKQIGEKKKEKKANFPLIPCRLLIWELFLPHTWQCSV